MDIRSDESFEKVDDDTEVAQIEPAHFGENEAEEVLAKITEHESQALAVAVQRKALNTQLTFKENAHRREADRLRHVYAAHFRHLAESRLRGKKVQTLRLTWGSVALSKKKAKYRITDMESAINYFRAIDPSAIKITEKVNDTTADKHLSALPGGKPVTWAEREEERIECVVSTGIPRTPPETSPTHEPKGESSESDTEPEPASIS